MAEEPRTAVAISLITGRNLEQTLHLLRELEDRGQIRHIVDDAGVMRWEQVEPEEQTVRLNSLGAQSFTDGGFRLTPRQLVELGFRQAA